MNWIKITDVSPNSPTEVLLYGTYEGDNYYCIGELGGCKNAPEFQIKDGKTIRIISAEYWCELIKPKINVSI